MHTLIALLFGLLCLICTIVILVDAFKRSVLKGLFCCLCGIYYIIYAIFEFKHENKLLIVLGSFLGGGVAGALGYFR